MRDDAMFRSVGNYVSYAVPLGTGSKPAIMIGCTNSMATGMNSSAGTRSDVHTEKELYESCIVDRALIAGADLCRFRFEWVSPLHSHAATDGTRRPVRRGALRFTLHGCHLRYSAYRRPAAFTEPLCTPRPCPARTGDREHLFFPRSDGPQRASSGDCRGRALADHRVAKQAAPRRNPCAPLREREPIWWSGASKRPPGTARVLPISWPPSAN